MALSYLKPAPFAAGNNPIGHSSWNLEINEKQISSEVTPLIKFYPLEFLKRAQFNVIRHCGRRAVIANM